MAHKTKTPKTRSGVAVAMRERYSKTTSVMTPRNQKRLKDARKSWRREEW